MMQLYNEVSLKISKLVTRSYSTSFSLAISFLNSELQNGITGIYGFVRLADEIVDTFHSFNKKQLLEKFEKDYYEALQSGVSLNPILHSFQLVVKKYKIPGELIEAFIRSMRNDLTNSNYKNKAEIDEYIYGSADVVGLMCLKVFTNGDDELYFSLKDRAMKLGSAFQKVNFLRDIKNDLEILGRRYFPEINNISINEDIKNKIITDIQNDFSLSYPGIKKLPGDAKLAVYIAYSYYLSLLKKIKKTHANKLLSKRIRISDTKKMILLISSFIKFKLNLI